MTQNDLQFAADLSRYLASGGTIANALLAMSRACVAEAQVITTSGQPDNPRLNTRAYHQVRRMRADLWDHLAQELDGLYDEAQADGL